MLICKVSNNKRYTCYNTSSAAADVAATVAVVAVKRSQSALDLVLSRRDVDKRFIRDAMFVAMVNKNV